MTSTTLIREYKSVVNEKNELKKRLFKLEQNLDLMADYTQKVKSIEQARNQAKNGQVVSQDKLFKKLGV
ncbi:MAG: hypothetical protein ABH822_00765 [Patescibacteria group bacterium]